LVSYHARYDDPDIGQFLSADTIIPGSPPLTVWPSDATAQGMWRSAGSGPVNPQDLNRYAYALNNPLKYTDPTGHLPLLPVLIAGGLALLKAIDDGWTAWDAFQATRTLADPEAPAEEKRAATANLALTAALEAAEPDDMLPVGLPRDDLLRVGIIGGSKGADAGRVVARGGAGADVVGGTPPRWPHTPEEMDDFLGLQGERIPDTAGTPGRSKVVWKPSDTVKITYEQHPYHTTAPAYHRGPHWHLDTPGKPHVRYLPGEDIPGLWVEVQ